MSRTTPTYNVLMAQAFKAQQREQRKSRPRVLSLEYFVAGVPPLGLFLLNVEDLEALLKRRKDEPPPPSALTGICLIGLAAYFEAFFKDLFAAIVNICPTLLEGFVIRRDCNFTLSEVLHLVDGSKHRIGSILVEHYDWGSAHSVNGLFTDLLKISPFSKDEAKRYAGFLNDRNLLVHDGGVYTFKYAGQKFSKARRRKLAHWQSLTVRKGDVLKWSKFFQGIARKSSIAADRAAREFVKISKVKLGKQRERALKLLASD
ncbi:MAG: hypothetical protein ACLQBK_24400 [Candidatus Sulfotelmatobacter sp.]